MGTRLVIVHVFDHPTVLGTEGLDQSFPNLGETAIKNHLSRLEKFCDEHLGSGWKAPDLQLQAVENNSVVKGVLSVAEEWHAQMIVVGTKGESALREIIMGSTTKRLIEKAPCPVMAIPADTTYKSPKTIVYATDFEEEDVFAIRKLTELAEAFDAEIKVLHIITEKKYEGEKQMEWFKEMLAEKVLYDKMEFKLFFSDDILGSLRTFLEDVDADMVVMLEREKKSIFKRWFGTSLVKKMETYGEVPLLSFRDGNHQLFYFKAVL